MDCEQFDRVVLDALYGELDGPGEADCRKHIEDCTRCRDRWVTLRSTREFAGLALAPPPAELLDRVASAVRDARGRQGNHLGHFMSRAGAYAMRPQMAMAAISLLAIGGAVFVLRPHPEHLTAQRQIRITERGEPEAPPEDWRPVESPSARAGLAAAGPSSELRGSRPRSEEDDGDRSRSRSGQDRLDSPAASTSAEGAEREPEQPAPVPPGASSPASTSELERSAERGALSDSSRFATAKQLYDSHRYAEAERAFDQLAFGPGKEAANADLYAARSADAARGCRAAAPKYELVAARHPGTSAAAMATWEAASCYKTTGDVAKARQLYAGLRTVAGYRDRAEAELSALAGGAPAAPHGAHAPRSTTTAADGRGSR